jgi:hypothetical protein
MGKKEVGFKLYFMFGLSILFFLSAVATSYFFVFDTELSDFTGFVTNPGVVTLTQAGTAGVFVDVYSMALGSGYFNATGDCSTLSYSTLDTNNSALRNSNLGVAPVCWINTTSFLEGNLTGAFVIVNNGSVIVNVSAIADKHGEDWLCAGDCPLTNVAGLSVLSKSKETNSCPPAKLTNGFENMITYNTNVTVGLCDTLDYADSSDSIHVFVNASIPKDTTAGEKTLTITFQALAV